MILYLTIILCILSAITTVVAFILYVRARMAELDRKEQLYKSIHFISLFIFVFLGVLLLIQLSDKLQSVTE
jgi:hypothetical protein